MARKPNPNKRNRPSASQIHRMRISTGKKISNRLDLEKTAERLISLFELTPEKRESRNILRNNLRQTLLKNLLLRTSAEEQCLTLVVESTRIRDIVSRYEPDKVPLTEGLKLHKAVLKVLNIAILSKKEGSVARENFKNIARQMEESIEEIKKALNKKTKGHLKIKQEPFFAIGFVGDNLIGNIMQSKRVDPHTKIGFEEIDRIVKKTLREKKK